MGRIAECTAWDGSNCGEDRKVVGTNSATLSPLLGLARANHLFYSSGDRSQQGNNV